MKPRTPTLISIAILTALITGAVFFQTMAQTAALPINVVFDPKSYTWDGLPPSSWNAEIWRQKVQDNANYASIRLEGIYLPAATPYPALHGPKLLVPFAGADVKAALFAKLPTHLGVLIPGIYIVRLTVSGTMIDGTPFEGDGSIIVTVLPPPP